MQSKERWTRTMRGQKADRVPIASPLKWDPLWRVRRPAFDGWESERNYQKVLQLVLEHCDDHGMARLTGYLDRRFFLLSPKAINESVAVEGGVTTRTYSIRTPMGGLRMVWRRDRAVDTDWCIEPLLKSVDDIAKLLSAPGSADGTPPVKEALALAQSLGDNGAVEVLVNDPLYGVAALCQYEQFLEWCVTDPDLIERAIAMRFERTRGRLESLLQAGYAGIFIFGGPEYAAPPMMPAKLFDRFVAKYDAPLIALIHRYGGLVHMHCHGRVKDLLPRFIEMGVDALDPLEPEPSGDVTLEEAKRICGGRMTLMGNIEASDLEALTPNEIEEKVRRAIGEGGPERFVLYPSSRAFSSLTDRYTANAIRYIEAGLKYGAL